VAHQAKLQFDSAVVFWFGKHNSSTSDGQAKFVRVYGDNLWHSGGNATLCKVAIGSGSLTGRMGDWPGAVFQK